MSVQTPTEDEIEQAIQTIKAMPKDALESDTPRTKHMVRNIIAYYQQKKQLTGNQLRVLTNFIEKYNSR